MAGGENAEGKDAEGCFLLAKGSTEVWTGRTVFTDWAVLASSCALIPQL